MHVDSHSLIAMCAPRLTFISYGIPEKGNAKWLDQKGSYMATVAAGAVFKLLGVKDIGVSNDYKTEVMSPQNTSMLDGELAWRQHDGGHTDAPNMKYSLNRLIKKSIIIPEHKEEDRNQVLEYRYTSCNFDIVQIEDPRSQLRGIFDPQI